MTDEDPRCVVDGMGSDDRGRFHANLCDFYDDTLPVLTVLLRV